MTSDFVRKIITILFNPFVYVTGSKSLGLGLVVIFLAGLIGSSSYTHFDGVLDTHTGSTTVPLGLFLAEGIIDWLTLSVVLWIFGKMVSPNAFRSIDLFGTQALARWPTVLISLLTFPPAYQRFAHDLAATKPGGKIAFGTPDGEIFLFVVLLTLTLVFWMIVLMYTAYSTSCRVRGGKAIGTFIAGLLLAELLSEHAIRDFLRYEIGRAHV